MFDATLSLFRKEDDCRSFQWPTSSVICILMDLFDATPSLFLKIPMEREVGSLDSPTSSGTCVLRDFLNVTSIPYRKIPIGLDFGPHRGSRMRLGSLRWPKLAKEVPRVPCRVQRRRPEGSK